MEYTRSEEREVTEALVAQDKLTKSTDICTTCNQNHENASDYASKDASHTALDTEDANARPRRATRPPTRLEDNDLEPPNAPKKKATVPQTTAMLKSGPRSRSTSSTKLDNIHAMIMALTQKVDNLKTTSGPQDSTGENGLNMNRPR
ncbi:hypothetical protein BDFG_05393 [Blastomyces dermatitidis ATCC 26199]|nr:hypothetical protein BDFG_05393 [Blastomyces dermatitidis ATCC 26199]